MSKKNIAVSVVIVLLVLVAALIVKRRLAVPVVIQESRDKNFDPAAAGLEKEFAASKERTRIEGERYVAQQKQEEIAALKTAIEEDKKRLGALEKKGSGIDDYKVVEENLKNRELRLKELLGPQK